jgi:DNA-binding transcriptional ArsR family regulator
MDMFYALAEPNRRSIIEMLASRGELSVSAIADKFRISVPAISQHLKVLREAKLIHMEKRAQQRIYRINPEGVHELEKWAQQLAQQHDALEELLKTNK